mgnify:FL=1
MTEQLEILQTKISKTDNLEEQLQTQLLTQESEHNEILEQEKQRMEQLQQAIDKLKVMARRPLRTRR